ncbi:MAG TPA: hypothetical protein G4N95_01380 [Anaerolineae bacterium]|nr:hypothetical protein [Anaerolineae bacterium]
MNLHLSKKISLHTGFRIILVFLFALIIWSFAYSLNAQAKPTSSPPSLVAPIDEITTNVSNYPPLGIPEFQWTSVDGATKYQILFSQDINFSGSIKISTANTTYTPISASQFQDGTWYWCVKVLSPEITECSPFRTFTKEWASSDNKPQLIYPLDLPDPSASLEFFEGSVFSWSYVTGAASYRIEIASSIDGFSNPILSDTTLAPTYQPKIKLENGTYFWRIVPLDPANRDGTPSDVRSFEMVYGTGNSDQITTLLEPEDGSFPIFTPTFRWTAVKGAQYYLLQYSTDPTFNEGVISVSTRNTSFTPTSNFHNDENYYWRVKVYSGASISEWSTVFYFKKKWYIQPYLLTPTNNYQHQRFPFFSWSPVPGASYYKIEVSPFLDFHQEEIGTTSNPFYTTKTYTGDYGVHYWRVTAYDKDMNASMTSETHSYVSYASSLAPHQVYPLYYYTPNEYPAPPPGLGISYDGIEQFPKEDRTVPLPIFIWHRVYVLDDGSVYPGAYRIEVSTSDAINYSNNNSFTSTVWTYDTENLTATPIKTTDNFTPTIGTDYYWHVRPLTSISGTLTGKWSQIWKTRIDTSLILTPTNGSEPELIRPADGSEFAELTPLLQWFPYQNADEYEIEISTDPDFAPKYIVDNSSVSYPAYAPQHALAQRSLGKYNFGTYYWHVRALNNGSYIGNWSVVRRFDIAAQSEWNGYRALGNTNNQLLLGSDPSSDTSSNYDLTNLYASQSADYWYFGFNANAITSTNMTYGLYLDIDKKLDSGATSDPRGYNVSTIESHHPEYAIYIDQENGEFTADNVWIYPWTGSSWGTPVTLSSIGGGSSDLIYPLDLYDVAMISNNNAWAVGKYGIILHWDGSSWSQVHSPITPVGDNLNNNLYDVDFVSSSYGWAVGENGLLLRWDGSQWKNESLSTNGDALNATNNYSSTLGLIVGDNGKSYKWNGSNWQSKNTTVSASLNDVSFAAEDEAWAVGAEGTIIQWNGTSWSEYSSSPTTNNLNAIDMISTTLGWAVGSGGTIIQWDGSNWSEYSSSPTIYNLNAIDMISTTLGWAVGSEGTIIQWNGTTWSEYSPSPTNHHVYAVSTYSSTDAIIVGWRGESFIWNGSSWVSHEKPITKYVEIQIPNTAIGMSTERGSYSLSLFSINQSNKNIQDSVPTDPNAPGGQELTRFASVTEHMNLSMPPDNVGIDPTTFSSIQPFFWDYPIKSPWIGANIKVYLDPKFTKEIAHYDLTSTGLYYARTFHAWSVDFDGDNTYYWRIRPLYFNSYYGSWSQAWQFERQGFTPKNLHESVTFATPTFSWSMVEGAEKYEIWVDNDSNFGSPRLKVTTTQNSYTPQNTFENGMYYWKVRVIRHGNVIGEWSVVKSFILSLPKPTGLTPNGSVVHRAPTLCWDPVLKLSDGIPVLAAWKYKIQTSTEPTFSSFKETIITEQTCWTPTDGYADGMYYWRVAMIDGNNKLGDFSDYATFTKQYPTTTLIEPANGSNIMETPTFVWEPVNGAASYKLEVSTDQNFLSIYDSITTNNTRYTPIKKYDSEVQYYWRVAIKDKKNHLGPTTDGIIIIGELPTNFIFLPLVVR